MHRYSVRYRLESTDMKVCATSSLLEKDQKANKHHKYRLKNPEKCYPGVTLLLPKGNTFGTPHFHKLLFIINWLYSGTIVVYFIGKDYMKRLPMKAENHLFAQFRMKRRLCALLKKSITTKGKGLTECTRNERKYTVRKITVLFVLASFFLILLHAESRTYIDFGANYSTFRTEKGESKPGFSAGICRKFYPIRSFHGFLSFGADYRQKKYLLENRTWRSGPDYDIYMWNIEKAEIEVNILFLEFPLSAGYTYYINNRLHTNISTGYIFSIPIKNNTMITNQRTVPLSAEEKKAYNYDYVPLDENYTTFSHNIRLGASVSYKRFELILNYIRALSVTEGICGLSIRDKIDSIEILVAFIF